ncbi:hypothetical protein ACROYT_G036176 [Oculina patagonica]
MFWKHLLVGGILLQLFQDVVALDVLQKYNLSDPMAICNDNSRAVVFIGRRSSRKWIIFFESGGLCTSKADCNKRYLNKNSTVLMTSRLLPDKVIGRDILSSVESENPTFFDYNHVLVPYCSSDLWLGSKTKASENVSFDFKNDPSVDNFSFRGQTIFRSVFEDLFKKYDLSLAEEIVVSGSSAGGVGILNHAKMIASHSFTKQRLKARIRFIIDSAWFINFQDGFKSRVKPEFGELANISSPACVDMSLGYSCCLSASCLISRGYVPPQIQTAFVFSLYDIYMFADVLKRLENEGKTAEDHVADFLSVVSMYGGAMNESMEISDKSHASFFVPACFQHTYFSTSSLWDEDGILSPLIEVTRDNGKFSHQVKSGTWISTKITQGDTSTSIRDFLSEWVKLGNTSSIKLIDSCIGAHCNPTCPDKLVFVDAGEVWRDVVKGVIIALSLVITLICFGLKASFVLYYRYLMRRQKKYLNDSETSQARKELPLCKSDEAVSIACLSLTYTVDVIKRKKKKTDNDPGSEESSRDRDSKTSLTLRDSITEEDSGSDLQEDEENKDDEADGVWSLPRRLTNGTSRDTDSTGTPQEQQTDSAIASMDGHSTWGSLAGSDMALLHSNHGNRERSVSCPAPVSMDATDSTNEKDGGSKKQILKGVSAYFNTGELVAIMGPSGCGKTTLLDLLTGRRRHGDFKGQVYINGVGLGRVQDWYSRKIGYVLQLAVPYYEELTVRQNLFFAAHMRLPKETSAAEKYERVEQIIAETGLTQMADTVIGGSTGLGLSGGQKRRLCVALQLINMPSVLFLDEPTSGLDASSSLELLNHLNLVAESGRLVILTIHQPRLEIFHLFHKILFLCDGQVAYYGEPSMAPEIFIKAYARATSEEYQLSEEAPRIDAKNPADTIMDLLNCSQARRAILDYYQASGEPQAVQEAIQTSQESASKTVTMERMRRIVDGAGSFNRIFVLESRATEKQTLGQILYFPLIFFTFGLIVGTVYWQAEDKDGVLLMSAYCVYCCASPLFLSSVLMAHLNKALNIFHLERQDGCGRSYENVIQTFVRTTAVCVLPVILCSAMSYFMVMTSYDLWKFVLVTIISLVLNQTWIAVYMMVICAHPGIAHRICPMVSAIGGFAGGFLVPRPQMPVVYNLLFYINPQFYGYSAITKVLLLNVRLKCEYESTLNCISTDGNAVLARFGLDSVNTYEHLVIMLGMTVISLLLSWLFLEAKYFTLRCFTKTPPAFSAESEEDRLEVLVQTSDKTPSKEDMEEIQLETPDIYPVKPFSRNRRSAKSRLGLISVNQGFHSVKLPAPRRRTSTTDSVFNTEQAIDGEIQQNLQAAIRRKRMASVSGKVLWKSTRQHMEERKIDFDKRMSQVQSIARRYTIKHSQSLRRRAKEKAAVPRRSTMAASAANDAMKQEFVLKRNGRLQEDCRKELFRPGVEESVEDEGSVFKEDDVKDFLDGRSDYGRESISVSGIASVKGDVSQAGTAGEKEDGHDKTKEQQQATSNVEGASLREDNSSQQVKKKDKGRPVKRVSLQLDIGTDILDV